MTILDTNVIVDLIAGDKKIFSLIQELPADEEIKTTSITEYELLKYKGELKKRLAEDFLAELTIHPFDEEAAKQAAALYEKLQEAGKMINENDLLIAGIALSTGDVLLTRDRKFANLGEGKIKIV
jgi:tRNA(fMet)-specific endonuclease VapC